MPRMLTITLMTLLWGSGPAAAQKPADYPIQPVPFTRVRVADAFWAPRLETNRKVTIPYAFKMCEETGRIDNFAVAGKLKQGKFRGIYFNDSDVFKVIEGAAYALSIRPDPELDKYLDDLIAKIAAAQEPDGYLYTARTLCGPDYMPPGGQQRWSDMGGGHELYCVGHLYEGAVAHHLATGKKTLLDVAKRNADLVCSVFGPGKKTSPCGHQEIEIGLVKLFRLTGDEKYLKTAKFFLDMRGRAIGRRLYGTYAQDHKPIVEQSEAVGHAVRAGYMYSGVADVAALTGDADYAKAIDRIWENVVGKKLYITGGIGARGGGEAFGDDYELPNRTAYCETCAAIANALWNHRMFLLHGDAKYLDVLERVIYNGFLSGVSLEGNRFFYPNPLESHSGATRAPWFDCACCPSNVVRFIPSIPGYAYAVQGENLYVNLFIAGDAQAELAGGKVHLKQETRYPWDGEIKITVDPAKAGARFALLVRIPGWAQNSVVASDLYRFDKADNAKVVLKVNGAAQALNLEKGFARLERDWKKGDTVELSLPMPVRRVLAHEQVKDDTGRVALSRGPVVYCAEGVDQKDGRVLNLLLPDDAELRSEFRGDLLGGVQVILGKAKVVRRNEQGVPVVGDEQELLAVPYYAWAHRKGGQMAVWLAREVSAARPLPGPSIASTSKVTVSGGGPSSALNDQLEPRSSIDHANPFFHWWPRKGTKEWVQYDFAKPEKVSCVEVYWFEDPGIGECRLPESWRLLAKVAGQWQEVSHPSGYGVEKDKYNRTTFDPIEAQGLRLEVQLPKAFSAGIHQWRVTAAGTGQARTACEQAVAHTSHTAVPPQVPFKVEPFSLTQVRLLDGPFEHAMDLDHKYLLELDPERLLHNFRVNAGLPSAARPLGGWEEPKCEVRGHFVGHYLSALALMYASTGDQKLKERADYIVAELAKCQAKFASGYLSAYPEEFIDRVEAYKRVWAPWYTLHKIYAGLLDVHLLCANAQALDVLKKACDWVKARSDKLSDEQMEKMLGNEHGGMNDVLAELYAVTGDQKYLRLSRRFNHHAVLDPLERREDRLTGLHANTQFPKILGAARQYELMGDDSMHTAATFFWDVVTRERSYVIGGNSDGEHFSPKESLSKHIGPNTTETCNTYNMLKITRRLFCWEPKPEYADYYERALYNHILASQNPETGMVCYYVPLKTGADKKFSTPNDAFWCCVGTGVENHAKYGDSVYFHEGTKVLYVNLFIASELTWKELGLKLRQETRYPQEDSTRLVFTCQQPVDLALNIRHPYWAVSGIEIAVGGKKQSLSSKPGSYVSLQRQWKTGDTVDIKMPMSLRTEAFRDNPHELAILYGPLVLCAEVAPQKPFPALVAELGQIISGIKPVEGKPLTFRGSPAVFRTTGTAADGPVTLVPFYQQYRRPYIVYWDVLSEPQWKARLQEQAAEAARHKALDVRTLDAVQIGQQESEKAHRLQGEKTGAGEFGGRHWRHANGGGWFSFEMKALPDKPLELLCAYWGSDAGGREFDILVDGTRIATEKLEHNRPDQFYDAVYPIPPDLTKGKVKVTIRFQAHADMTAGGVFDCRILRKE